MKPDTASDHRARWAEQAKGMDIKALHWQYADSIRQASHYRGSQAQVHDFYQERADFFLDKFQKARKKAKRAAERLAAKELKGAA